ncbi:MAG TPA: hypothetical protein VIV60_14010, partial [Polyangiaceae bacterium]
MKPRLAASLIASCLIALSAVGYGETAYDDLSQQDRSLFDAANSALAKGAPTEAIQQLELLADHGVIHPDVSFNRAVAYALRAHSPQARPGDYGRATYALSEVLALRPDDVEAAALLERVERELSRARSRRGTPSVLAKPRLSRAIVGLLPENLWAGLSVLASIATTLGILFRFGASRPRQRLAGGITAWLSAALLALTAFGLYRAVQERNGTRRGIVVAEEARLLDAAGAPMSAKGRASQD